MFFSTEQAFVFAAELERALRQNGQGTIAVDVPRDADGVLASFAKYGETKFHIFGLMFESIDGADDRFAAQKPEEITLQSLLMNYDPTTGVCEILLNLSLLNNCWNRFCRVKEAAHVVIGLEDLASAEDKVGSATPRPTRTKSPAATSSKPPNTAPIPCWRGCCPIAAGAWYA